MRKYMKKTYREAISILAIILLFLSFTNYKAYAVTTGYVKVNIDSGTLTIRSTPSTSGSAVGSLDDDTIVQGTDLSSYSGWYKIKTGDGTIGYCNSTYMSILSSTTKIIQINTGDTALNVRQSAPSGTVIGSIPDKEYVEAVQLNNPTGWHKVIIPGTTTQGYVSATYCLVIRDPISAPTLSANITAATNSNVIVSISYPSNASLKKYSLNSGSTWLDYSSAITFTQNGTIYAQCTNSLGVWSSVASYTVSNIDKTAPTAPTVSASITTPTNENVAVSITYASDATLKKYSLDGGSTWLDYSAAITFNSNGTIKAQCRDSVGNWSSITSYTVSNIDKTAPSEPTICANITDPTNQDVILTITYAEDASIKQYSLDEGSTWFNYTSPVTFNTNGTIKAKCSDAAGNCSTISSYTISNIDKIYPDDPTISVSIPNATPTNQDVILTVTFAEDAATKQYSLDNGSTWLNYSEAVTFSSNGIIKVKCCDAVGNWSETVEYSVTNIDKTAPVAPSFTQDVAALTYDPIKLTITYPNEAIFTLYSIDDGDTWLNYTKALEIKQNMTVKAKCLDAAGNYSAIVEYSITNIQTVQIPETDDYSDTMTQAYDLGIINNSFNYKKYTLQNCWINTVGDTDYFKLTISRPMNLEMTANGKVSTIGSVYFEDGTAVIQDVLSDNEYKNFSTSIQLNTGTYYLKLKGNENLYTLGKYDIVINLSLLMMIMVII